MLNSRKTLIGLLLALLLVACGPDGYYINEKYLCDFEGEYWNALVDSDPNGTNLLNGTITTSWHDAVSGLSGSVSQPYAGYWEGLALSNHCSTNCEEDGQPDDQLYIYAEGASSGKNALICNCFFGGVEMRFENKSSHIESIMVANTTYLHAVATKGNHITPALGANESIWVEASGYINGSEDIQATAKFYLYKNGKAVFDGWERWYMTSMCKVDRVVFEVKWNGEGYNPYPAYFAMDDITIVQQKLL